MLHGNYLPVRARGRGAGRYLLLSRTYSDRDFTTTARGKRASTSKIEESQRLGGFVAGLEALYATSGAWPVTGRLSAGVLLGSLRDKRTGDGFIDSTGKSFAVDSTQTPGATSLYLAPEVRIGRRFGEQFELSVGATLYVLAALSRPSWDGSKTVSAGADGIGTSASEKLTGGVMLFAVPSVGARYQF